MENLISKVNKNSIAEELGIEIGDKLLKINGKDVNDVIDYKYLLNDDYVVLTIEKRNKEIWELDVEKEFYEDIGVEFENSLMDNARHCHNRCIFCFIDQLPKGLRQSLYFKDDDSRLSFLQGNFVTFTNMSERDIDRIIEYRISPINISVQTTNKDLRIKMLRNKNAGNLLEIMNKLRSANIEMNCQIVSCPGINNGDELVKTVEDLFEFYPQVKNVAIVPVGLSKYRENLYKLKRYDKSSLDMDIKNVELLQKKYMKLIKKPFARLSDEFYLLAGKDVPDSEFYDGYEQLEDGIGMVRYFIDNIDKNIEKLSKIKKGSFTFVTGKLSYDIMKDTADKIMKYNPKIDIDVKKIKNNFLGENITVSGLITGTDIIDQLSKSDLKNFIVIPSNMLKYKTNIFIDDFTTDDIEKKLNRSVLVCDYGGENLIQVINDHLIL